MKILLMSVLLGLLAFPLPSHSAYKGKALKRVVIVLIVNTPYMSCGTLNCVGVSGPISNCSPYPNERELSFMVDDAAGFDMSFNLSIPNGGPWNVTVQGYGNPISVCNPCYGFASWSGHVGLNPNTDVTRIAVVATRVN